MNVFCLFVFLFASSYAKIFDESGLNGIQPESTTLADVKDKTEVIELLPEPPCFHSDVEAMCFNKSVPETKPNCECELHPNIETALVCCNVTDLHKSITCVGNTSSYLNIHVINAHLKDLNIGQMNSHVKQVHSLVITDG